METNEVYNISGTLPKQVINDNLKTEEWAIDTIRHYCNTIMQNIGGFRKRQWNMNDNYNLVTGKIRRGELEKANNPMGLEGELWDMPDVYEDTITIINPTINTLIGEEFKRSINWRACVINPDAVSKKEKDLQAMLMEKFAAIMTANLTEDQVKIKLQELEEYTLYTYQDIRERRAGHLLHYYYEQLKLNYVFNDGFKDALIAAEEIYRIDLINNEPRVVRCNPLATYTIRTAESTFIEDSDAIIEDSYMAIGQIISEFGDSLTKEEIRKLYGEGVEGYSSGNVFSSPYVVYNREIDFTYDTVRNPDVEKDMEYSGYNRMYRNTQGEHRVMRVTWRSVRKLYELTGIDEETGLEIVTLLDGNTKYKPNKNKGEKFRELWVTEWWQGIRIGYDIFIKCEPCPLQRRDINNPFISYPPYVGTIYNINDRTARSLVDELKPIQREWTVFKKKVDLLWSRNMGKLVKIDVSKIPDFGQNAESNLNIFMNWMQVHGIVLENPFQEGAKGQFSGQFQSGIGVVDAELSTTINNAIEYMSWLISYADRVAGVNEQRRGQGAASEGLGVTEYRISQSTNQTEERFAKHDYTKLRVLEALLETIKYSMRNGNKKLQYITDDLSAMMLNDIDDDVKDADFGIKIVASNKVLQLEQKIEQRVEYALNNGMPLSDALDIDNTTSISDKVMKLKRAERNRIQQAQQQAEQQAQMQQQMLQMQQQMEQVKMQHEIQLKQMEIDAKLQIEAMKIQAGAYENMFTKIQDDNRNGIEDNVEIKKQELVNKTKQDELRVQQTEAEKQRKFEAEQAEKERQNKLMIAKMKPKSTK